jgi:uncharacterized protein YjbI with pentapeptide repeats
MTSPRRWSLIAVGSVVGVLVLGWLAFQALPDLLAPERSRNFGVAAEAQARTDVRTSALQFFGGVVLALGAAFTAVTYGLNRQGQITERFTRAIDQLGHAELDVRLGGIYALERIARDSAADRGPIVEVLTAFIRTHAPWPPARPDKAPQRLIPRTDVQAALTVLGRRHRYSGPVQHIELVRKPEHVEEYYARFPRLNLDALDLRGADLHLAHLDRADFNRAHLECAELTGARLENCGFTHAHLEGATLRVARLREAHFQEAYLAGAVLDSATLKGAYFGRVIDPITGSTNASEEEGADLTGAILTNADLRDADLRGADLTRTDLKGAVYNSHTSWPDDVNFKARGATLETES